ncbi:MAG: YdaU family protein [Planctomycetia bacterium]|nr:YdaU family protein [Planctomycetia bacterium]
MAKEHWTQFHQGDWLKDPAVSSCSPATRGIYFDALCMMFEEGRTGLPTRSKEILARLCRCTVLELEAALTELQATAAADVTFRDGNVTIINHRMKREYETRGAARLRKQKSRDKISRNGDVTNTPEPRANTLCKSPEHQARCANRLWLLWRFG